MKAPPSVPISAFNSQLFSRWWSPGSLPYGTNVEDLLDPSHSSKPRNKLIAQVFYDLRLIERYGSGIQRILGECRAAGLPDPVFENFTGGFRVRFRQSEEASAGSTGEVTGEVSRLLHVMTGEMKRREIQEELSLRHEAHFREMYLRPALDAGLIEMVYPEKPRSSKQRYRLTERGRVARGAR